MQGKKRDSLTEADALQRAAARVGFDWPDAKGPAHKVREELRELEREAGSGMRDTIEAELGDLLFAVVNLSRKLNIAPARALARANRKFQARFRGVEKLAKARGLRMGKATLAELDGLWDQVKRR